MKTCAGLIHREYIIDSDSDEIEHVQKVRCTKHAVISNIAGKLDYLNIAETPPHTQIPSRNFLRMLRS